MLKRCFELAISNIGVITKYLLAVCGGGISVSPLATLSTKVKIELVACGKIRVNPKSRIIGKGLIRASSGTVVIGEHCEIRDSSIQANQGTVVIKDNTFLNSGCIITSVDRVEIGEGCAFGTNVSIYDHDHVFVREGKQPWNETRTAPIVIGDNCWIGANVLILRGTTIGDNCVIAGGTVVKGKIPPHSIVRNNRELIIEQIR